MTGQFLARVQAKVRQDKFELSQHAQREAGAEMISVDDIKYAIFNGRELEPYPNDPRGPSCLIVGQDSSARWIHALCGNFDHENALIITVYVPQLPKWKDPFTRGGRS